MGWGYHTHPRKHTRGLYTVRQLAAAFGVKPAVVYWLARSGKIPSKRFPVRCLRFPPQAVTAMVNRGFHMQLK